MALGPVRFVRKGDQRVQCRDWMTDPADLDSLLAWTNQKLGINYGKVEADFEHFSFDPRELPALLFAGHNGFNLGDEVRQRLARYVLDGGMIIGDACCGWKDFNDAFRRKIQAIFPDRPMRKHMPDDPIFASYLQAGRPHLPEGRRRTLRGRSLPRGPERGLPHRCGLLAGRPHMRLGRPRSPARPAGRDRPVAPDRRNYVTYLLGSYQLGRFLSSTKVYHEADVASRDDFIFA